MSEEHASQQMMRFITMKWVSMPLYIAAQLGIADMLADGPKPLHILAQQSGASAPHLYRILRALVSVGIFAERQPRVFSSTPLAACLQTGAMRSMALLFLSDWHNQAWDKLLQSVMTGENAFQLAHGMPSFEWLEQHPHAANAFHEANAMKAERSHSAILDVYDFTPIKTLTDVGGGQGTLMMRILKAHPHITGVIADRPSVLRQARQLLQANDLDARCSAVNCDFFTEIPAGSEAYILSHILHDWGDEQCQCILQNCSRAMSSGATLLVLEMVIPLDDGPSIAKLLDLEVLVMGDGCERTEAEFHALFERTAFRINRIIPTQEHICLLECIKQ